MSDIGPLAWVKSEIDLALERAASELKAHAADPQGKALAKAAASVHQAHGALAVVGLEGVSRFSDGIERLLAALAKGLPDAQAAVDAALAGIAALRTYLDELVAGQPDRPLRLFAPYKAMALAAGDRMRSPADLFQPDLSQRPPKREKDIEPLNGDAKMARWRAARLGFERGLVKWLKSEGDDKARGATEMKIAVAMIEATCARAEERAYWWVCIGVLEALAAGGLADATDEFKPFALRLGVQIKRLTEEGVAIPESALVEALYFAAVAKTDGAALAQVRAAYRLEDLVPREEEDAAHRLGPALRRLRELLAVAKEDWTRFSAGTMAALPPFHERISKIADEANATDQSDYICLTGALRDLTNRLRRDPSRHNEAIALEVATALLLAEAALDEFPTLGPSFGSLVETLIVRIEAASQGEPLDELAMPELLSLSQRAQEKLLAETVIREIRTNFGVVEQTLDAYFREPAKKANLMSLGMPLRQIEGAFVMLNQPRAASVLRGCMQDIDRFSASSATPPTADFEALAKKFAALSFFVEQLPSGQADIDRLLDPEAASVTDEELDEAMDESPEVAPTPQDDEAELLGVFLAEAYDVLTTVENALPLVHSNLADSEALGALRRGFHTLKGSSRMVGLDAFGEAAWSVEQVMNNWLDAGRAATPELLDMLSLAQSVFRDEVQRIEEDRVPDDTATEAMNDLHARCRVLLQAPDHEAPPEIAGELAPSVVEAEAIADESAPVVAEEPPSASAALLSFPSMQNLRIGPVEVAPVLYDLYLKEMRGHVAVLHEQLGVDAVPSREAVRAAHTAASISAGIGFSAIHTLAHALESALERFAAVERRPDDEARLVFARSVGALDGMVGAVAEQRLPTEEAGLAAELGVCGVVSGERRVESGESRVESEEVAAALPEVNLVPVDRRAQRIHDEIDPQLLPIFLEESIDLMATIGEGLRVWRGSPLDGEIANGLKRALHTLKGSARMAGAMQCGELFHGMESRIEQSAAQGGTAELLEELELACDRAAALIEQLRNPQAEAVVQPSSAEPSPPTETTIDTLPALPGQSPQVMLRVRAGLVDQLVNEAGEIAIARARIERQMQQIKGALGDFKDNVGRLREQMREIEMYADTRLPLHAGSGGNEHVMHDGRFDPLELDRYTRFQEVARMMAESVGDAATVQGTLLDYLDQADVLLAAQARLNRDLSQRLMNVRRVPFNSIAERLHRVVRQAAKDADKRANLDIRHGQTELDRSMLDALAGPLEHLLRNCVAHGLEDKEGRSAAGKSEFGQVSITLAQEGNEIVIVIGDDGKGLDYARIRQRAIERGLFSATNAPALSETETLGQLIFQSGFSTAASVNALAGRGVGMDAVKSAVTQLGGRIAIASESGKGARVTLTLPLTLAITQALLVKAHGRTFAIPASMVVQASEHKLESIASIRSAGGQERDGQHYPWRYLPELFNDGDTTPAEAQRYWLVLVRGGSERIALEVDDLLGNEEIVVKPLGPQLSRVPGLAGATVLADGEIVLIINPIALIARAREQGRADRALSATTVVRRQAAARANEMPLVMVVDDSLTVRKVTSRLLARNGYETLTAKDGVDALEQLDQTLPDLILLDIEMPRMDGFGFARAVRADARLRHLPIIMITSRSADKHRQLAAEIGVNHFLGKPYDEEELLALISKFIQPN